MKKKFSFQSKKEMVRAILLLAAFSMLFLFFWHHPLIAFADTTKAGGNEEKQADSYGSWIQKNATYESIYGKGKEEYKWTGPEQMTSLTGDTWYENAANTWSAWTNPTQWVSFLLGGIFMLLGGVVNGLLGGRIIPSGNVDDVVNLGHVDLTMDSVIFGRLLNGHPVNFVSWELRNGNLYGIVSSFAYRLFWDIAFSAFVLSFFVMLIRQLLSGGDSKKRAELKENLLHGFFIFLMLYLIPQIADICVYLRDWLLKVIYSMMSGDANLNNISYTDLFMAQWWSVPWYTDNGQANGVGGVAMGILFFAASCAGLIFAIDYIKIAIKQTALFAFFPVFAILSMKNKKLLSNWLTEFIPNLFIPVIDCVLLMLPVMVIRIANSQGLTGTTGIFKGLAITGTGLDIGVFLIVCIMIFSIIPMRKEILKLLGQTNPLGGSRGFGGIMAAGMMAMRMMGRGGVTSGIESYGALTPSENLSMANALENFGTAGQSGVSAMAAASAENIGSAMQTQEMVSERTMEEIKEGAVGSFADEKDGPYLGNSPDFGEETSVSMMPGADGYDYSVDAFDSRISEDMDNVSAEMETPDFYQKHLYEPTREENLEQMEGYQEMMQKTGQDIDTLSAENGYDKALLQRYENLGQDIEHARAGGGMEIIDSAGNPISSGISSVDAMESEREAIERQIKSRIEGYAPAKKQAADGVSLNFPDERTRPGSAAGGDLEGRMKEVIKDRESQIADYKKAYNEQKAGLDEARKREAAFAKESQNYGSSGEKFDSAEEYRKRKEVDAVFKQAANYKNFDTKGISEHLDPATRAKMYRERAQKQMEAESRARKQKMLTAAGAISGAAIGGSAMLFGGEGAAMSGATIGGMAGAMGARGVANPARAARKEEIQRRSGLLENPHKTKITVHPKRTGIEGVRKIEAAAPKTKESVATKRKAKESMQKGESEILKKAEGIYRTDGHLAKGNQMIDKAMKDGES